MTHRANVKGKALLAIMLMVGFYLLTMGIVGGLLTLVILTLTGVIRLAPRAVSLSIVVAAAVLVGVVPRPRRWIAPGVRITPKEQPRLFELLREIATRAGEKPPAEVYVNLTINAGVGRRGGFMGIGGRRVLVLGLPLVQTLTRSQLVAILAHEFGHFHGGLSGLVYGARCTMARTVSHLQDTILQKPYLWYGTAFMRVSHTVSRDQEFAADEFAARLVGRAEVMRALRRSEISAALFPMYFETDVAPIVNRGYLPDIGGGFRRFIKAHKEADTISAILQQATTDRAVDPYDTHPPLALRLEAMKAFPDGGERWDRGDVSAMDVVQDVEELQVRALGWGAGIGEERVRELVPIAWEDILDQVWRPDWNTVVDSVAHRFVGVTPTQYPRLVADPTQLLGKEQGVGRRSGSTVGNVTIIGVPLMMALERSGWTIECRVGRGIAAYRGDHRIGLDDLGRVYAEEVTPAHWMALCDAAGTGDLDIGRALGVGVDRPPELPVERDLRQSFSVLAPPPMPVIVGERVYGRRVAIARRNPKAVRRRKILAATVLGGLGVVIALAFITDFGDDDPPAKRDPAATFADRVAGFEAAWEKEGVDPIRPFLTTRRNHRAFTRFARGMKKLNMHIEKPAISPQGVEEALGKREVTYTSSAGEWVFRWRWRKRRVDDHRVRPPRPEVAPRPKARKAICSSRERPRELSLTQSSVALGRAQPGLRLIHSLSCTV
ncbi:MAG: hypothetical protein CMJ83_09055, partial [Planctomycetes bacterium]|nr:hypothetical protein [Planctomycetota bacterium]